MYAAAASLVVASHAALLLAAFALAPSCFAQETAAAVPATAVDAAPAPGRRWDLYLSGYAYHNRGSYTESRLQKLNEKAWGGGFGSTLRDERGNDSSWYALATRDSNRHVQYMAGYAYQWIYPVRDSRLEAGIGLTAVAIKRQDWFDGRPFPALLPVASLGTEKSKLVVTYVPHLSTRKGKGNVTLFVLKLSF
jgi:palmitoyl transferase